MIFLFGACRAPATVSVSELGFLVIPRSRRQRGIPHRLEKTQSEIPRGALSKVCHSERSEESALVRPGPELQILRFAQDDSEGLEMTA
jgi:hypothetical protein